MLITISNKKTEIKPVNKGLFFSTKGKNPFKWNEVEITLDNFKTIVEKGYTITYLLNDITNLKRKGNYRGTQFIAIDIDSCDLEANLIIDRMKVKPTIYHTTFSHKTESKNFKNCYHFYFFLDEVILGETNFNILFSKFIEGIEDIYDDKAKDCNRCIFTSNKNLKDFEYGLLGNIIRVKDYINNNNVLSFDEFDKDNCPKIDSLNILSPNTIYQESKNWDKIDNDFNLDKTFYIDLNSLQRSEFLAKYSYKYPYFDKTLISKDMYCDGYADLRGFDYYEVPTSQYSWNKEKGKAEIKKIENGHRTTMLWLDAIAFMKIIPDITKEYLVYLLILEVYQHFMNGDGQMSNHFIIEKAKDVWNNIDHLSINPIKKTFKLDLSYWNKQGISLLEASRIVRSKIKSKDIGSLYDCSLSIEENLKVFRDYGVKTKKETLIKWCEDNYIDWITDKEVRDKTILYYYEEDNSRSYRDIEKLCKDNNNLKVSKSTIQRVIKDNQ